MPTRCVPKRPSPNLESELRFYSVWWIGAGLSLIWLAPRVAERALELRVFSGLLFLAGVSRVLAALDTDWLSTGQLILMGLELVLPVVLVTWQARVARSRRRWSAGVVGLLPLARSGPEGYFSPARTGRQARCRTTDAPCAAP